MANKKQHGKNDFTIEKLIEERCFAKAVFYMHSFGMSNEDVKKKLLLDFSESYEEAKEMIASVFPDVNDSEIRVARAEEYVDLDDIISRAREYVESLPKRGE